MNDTIKITCNSLHNIFLKGLPIRTDNMKFYLARIHNTLSGTKNELKLPLFFSFFKQKDQH